MDELNEKLLNYECNTPTAQDETTEATEKARVMHDNARLKVQVAQLKQELVETRKINAEYSSTPG